MGPRDRAEIEFDLANEAMLAKEGRLMANLSERCSNCTNELTEENIRLALEDAKQFGLRQSQIRLYCPSYNPATNRCEGWEERDEKREAHWRTN